MEPTHLYIEILKYGSKLESVNYQDLIDHLNKKENRPKLTAHTTTLINIFDNSYLTLDGKKPEGDRTLFYFLKPELLGYLTNYESLNQSKRAIRIATWSLIVTGFVAVVQICMQIFMR